MSTMMVASPVNADEMSDRVRLAYERGRSAARERAPRAPHHDPLFFTFCADTVPMLVSPVGYTMRMTSAWLDGFDAIIPSAGCC